MFLSVSGYFKIGLLSDDYNNFYDAVNTGLTKKFTGHLPYTNDLHLRPLYYLSLQVSKSVHDALGYDYDNFIFYRFQNLAVYFLLTFIAGLIVFQNTNRPDIALVASSLILIFPNNLHNICWTAGRDDIMLTLFSLTSIYFTFRYLKKRILINILLSFLFFILALLSKETAIALPFVIMFLIFTEYGINTFRNRKVLFANFFILAVYIIYKFSLNQVKPSANSVYYIFTAFIKALISLIIPFDYLSLRSSFSEANIFLFIYIMLLVIVLILLIKNIREYKTVTLQAFILFLIIIFPNLLAGYFRPQLILFPFSIITIYIVSKALYNYNFKNSLRIVSTYFFIAVIFFWSVTAKETVKQWSSSYELARGSLKAALSVPFDFTKKNVIIGQPGRVKQSFMFDKITGPYNYFRYYDNVIKDTLYDMVLLGAINNESIKAPLIYKRINSDEFDVLVNNEQQFFYIEGIDDKSFSRGIMSNGVFVISLELNSYGKSKKIKVRKLAGDITCYIYIKDNYLKIF